MSIFTNYSDVLFAGFTDNIKTSDLLHKKHGLFLDILRQNHMPSTDILFVGFSPWCLALGDIKFKITEVSQQILDYLDVAQCNYEFKPLEDFCGSPKSVAVVVAADEYFTFAECDSDQLKLVQQLSAIASGIIITTLRDYKNQDYKDREFSQPIIVHATESDKIYLEHHEYSARDKNSSISTTYAISTDSPETTERFGPFHRRNMYFKQLARFSIDSGAKSFIIHKNLMYKSTIKKNYEHVITIKF